MFMRALKSKSRAELAVGAFLLVSGSFLVYAVGDMWWSKRSALLGPTTWSETPPALVDAKAPTFQVETLDGDTVSAPRPGRKTLLIAYVTTCRFCDASTSTWRRVAAERCGEADILLVSRESIEIQEQYWDGRKDVRRSECPADALVIGRVLDVQEFASGYGLRGTPTHFVIGQDQVVSRTWLGAVGRRVARNSLLAALQ